MKNIKMYQLVLPYALWILCLLTVASCKPKPTHYSTSDFEKVSKIDAHFHYNTTDTRYLKYAESLNFRLISPNVDTEMSIDSQLYITSTVKKQFPDKFAFLGTFSVDSFGKPGFAENTIAHIAKCMQAGASGIKIWKNIGMVLKDSSGHYVMVDNQAFDPIFNFMEENNIPVTAHLGEPRDCWLPENQMTVDNDKRYYTRHPQYYMYLQPDAPSYEDQINARDNLLKKHPKLIVTGAHLASLEWNVDELARHFDQYPNLYADLAARIGHLQCQSLSDRERVRNFLIKYQDRILYATDASVNVRDANYSQITAGLRARWKDHWAYLATDSSIVVKDLGNKAVKGLQLPYDVIDKIYCKNAMHFFTPKAHNKSF